jgi:sugar O-acyltransferase (sialic acid O-acetyltransferase NeuD family)
MKKVIIFGVEDLASLAHFYLKYDSDYEVVAFCLTKNYLSKDQVFEGLPVIDFEEVHNLYSPDEYLFFAPLSARGMNKLRESIYNEIKVKGYKLISYVSSKVSLFPGVKIGDNCFILEDNTIQPYTEIGNNVIMWSGNHIGHHSVIKDHIFFASHVVLSGNCVVEPYCFFGVNSTVMDGVCIAEGTLVGMGASITQDTEAYGVYGGQRAKKGFKPSTEIY